MKWFILATVLIATAVVMLCSGAYIYIDTRTQINEVFDARLAQSARVVDLFLDEYIKSHNNAKAIDMPEWLAKTPNDPNIWHSYERKLHFQILDEKGAIILKSPHAPDVALSELTLGFNHFVLKEPNHRHERSWRTFTLKSKSPNRWLVAAERDDVRSELTSKIAKRSLSSIWFILPILSILIIVFLKKGLNPINELTVQIANRSPNIFDHFIAKTPTRELSPLYQELNRLLDAQKITLEREKQFTDSAAHELRTPLTILKINAENAINATSKEEQQKSLHKLVAGIDRSSRLIQQLLVLARLENPSNLHVSKLSLRDLVKECIAELASLALRKHQLIELRMPDASFDIVSNAALLGILLSNLVDNAIRYTPERGHIVVELVEHSSGEVRISVIDSGVGVAPEHLHRLGEAFFRADSGRGDGTGLGLSIVKRISELLGVSLELANHSPSGFIATVALYPLKQAASVLTSPA